MRTSLPAAALVIFAGLQSVPPPALPDPPETTPAIDGYRGVAIPRRQATLAAAVPGRLVAVEIEEGDTVLAGTVVARLDDTVAAARLGVAEQRARSTADVDEAALALADARAELEAIGRLMVSESGTDRELRDAQYAVDLAGVRLEAARVDAAVREATVALERATVERLRVRAPFDGRVLRVTGRAGEVLETADPVLLVAALDQLEATIHVPVSLYPSLVPGATYRLAADAPFSRDLPARLRYVDPLFDGASRTARCVFDIDNRDGELPAGFGVVLPAPVVAEAAAAASD